MASPHVAAAAALLVSLGVTRPEAVESYLRTAAQNVGAVPGDPDRKLAGAGELRAGDAIADAALQRNILRIAGLMAAMVLAFRLAKKKGSDVRWSSPALWAGAILSGLGLFFLP